MTDQCEDVGLRFDVDDAVVTITLCRPETGNAQTPRMWATLAEIGESLPSGARVVVLRAEGESFSSVPGDISLADLERLDDRALTETVATFQEAFSWWRRPDVVTIAAVQGHAVGAGFQLALACDLRVLAEDARFAMRETSLGLVPDLGGTQPLVEAIGYSRALEVCVTGRWIDADEARHLGLATIVVPREDLDGTVADLAAALIAPPHDAVTATKALLRTAAARSFPDQLSAERSAQVDRIRALPATWTGNNEL